MKRLIASLFVLAAGAASAAPAAAPAPVPLAPYAGKIVYLDFWASWCGPCAESFPWLNAMRAKYPGVTIVGVNVDTDAKDADEFLKRHPATFDIVRDPKGVLPEQYKIEGMPTSIILDGSGRELHRHTGFRPDQAAAYEAAIREALPPGAGGKP